MAGLRKPTLPSVYGGPTISADAKPWYSDRLNQVYAVATAVAAVFAIAVVAIHPKFGSSTPNYEEVSSTGVGNSGAVDNSGTSENTGNTSNTGTTGNTGPVIGGGGACGGGACAGSEPGPGRLAAAPGGSACNPAVGGLPGSADNGPPGGGGSIGRPTGS